MTKVFVAIQGAHYEREVCAVYSTKKKALKAGWNLYNLEEFELNE